MWTSPTGHTYRVSPEELLQPDADPADGAAARGGMAPWAHQLLAAVLPEWVGWPAEGRRTRGGEPAHWPRDWASAVFADDPPDPARSGGSEDDGDGDEPYLFDELPAA